MTWTAIGQIVSATLSTAAFLAATGFVVSVVLSWTIGSEND